MSIEAIAGVGGAEWQIAPIQEAEPAAKGGGFASMLGSQLEALNATQAEAANQSMALATGTATDPSEVVMAVERAQLSMQMAGTLRNKGVEVVQELMRTTV